MSGRVIADTKLFFSRPDGQSLAMGEGEEFEIYGIRGLGIGEIDRQTTGNALYDGELWLASRVLNREMEIQSEWGTVRQRLRFTDFFQHNVRFSVRLLFNGSDYYGSCVLSERYEHDDEGGGWLYGGDMITLYLYFDDPHLYTDMLYQYAIGYGSQGAAKMYTDPVDYERVIPPGTGFIHVFSTFSEAQEYVIENPSSTPNGIQAVITAFGNVENPRISNLTTGEHVQINTRMTSGDTLRINTQIGFIEAVLNETDVLRFLSLQSRMVQLAAGKNTLLFSADSGAQSANCEISFRGKVLAL